MKYILSIIILIVSIDSFGQTFGFPSILPGNSKPQITVNQGSVGTTTGFTFITNFADTTAANVPNFIRNQPGITIMVNGYELWMRDSLAKSWVLLTGAAIDNNQWFGTDAFATYKNGTLTTGTQNLAIGKNSLQYNIEGIGNTALGFNTLSNNDSSYNTAVGYISMRQNLNGFKNTAVGSETLLNNTTGYINTAIGSEALYSNTTAAYNTGVGSGAMRGVTTGSNNTAIGAASMFAATIGFNNTALGTSSMALNIAGIGNTAIGYDAGSTPTGGDYNIFLGFEAGKNASQMATPINSIAIGKGVFTTASNQIVIGNTDHTDLRVYGVEPGAGNATLVYDSATKKVYYGSPSGNSANNGITDSSGRFVLGGTIYKTTTFQTGEQLVQFFGEGAPAGLGLMQISATVNGALLATSPLRAVTGQSSGSGISSVGVAGISSGGYGLTGLTTGSSTNDVIAIMSLSRYTSGTAANGIGGKIEFSTMTDIGGVASSNELISKWTDATHAARTSQFDITGVSNAVTETYANFQTGGIIRINNLADTISSRAYARTIIGSNPSGDTWQQTLTTGSTFDQNNIVDLDGNTLDFQEGGTPLLTLTPSNFTSQLRAADGTGESFVKVQADVGDPTVLFSISSSDGVNTVSVIGQPITNVIDITAGTINLVSTLGGTSTGYVWTLQNTSTGEGAWAAVPGGGGAAWNGLTAPTGSLSLAFDDGEVTVFTNGSNTEDFFTMTNNSLTSGRVLNLTSTSITTGNLLTLTSTSTASNGFSLATLSSSGVNASSSRTSVGLTISVTNTGTTPTNIGMLVTANTNILAPSTDNSTTLVINSAAAAARLQFGTLSGTTTSGAIYGPVTASSSNYGLAFSSTQTSLNAVTDLELRIGATVVASVFSNGVGIGIGAAAPTSLFDIQSITEQQRTRYDASNYFSTTVGSTGAATFNAVGSGSSFRFSDIVHLGTAGSVLGQITFNGNTSGTITMASAAAAGTWTWTLPTTDGANDYDYMVTNGSGTTRWEAGFNKTVQTLTDAVSTTWNVNSGGNAAWTLTAAGRTLVITNAVAGYTYTVRIIQGGAGSFTVTTWPTGTVWPNNGTAPTLTTTAGRYDLVTFYYDGTRFIGNYNFNYQ